MGGVLLIGTGDTIAYGHAGVLTAAGLLATVPPDRIRTTVTPVDVRAEPSWDTTPATMVALGTGSADGARTWLADL